MQRSIVLVLFVVVAVLSFEFDPRVLQKLQPTNAHLSKRADTCVDVINATITLPDYQCQSGTLI